MPVCVSDNYFEADKNTRRGLKSGRDSNSTPSAAGHDAASEKYRSSLMSGRAVRVPALVLIRSSAGCGGDAGDEGDLPVAFKRPVYSGGQISGLPLIPLWDSRFGLAVRGANRAMVRVDGIPVCDEESQCFRDAAADNGGGDNGGGDDWFVGGADLTAGTVLSIECSRGIADGTGTDGTVPAIGRLAFVLQNIDVDLDVNAEEPAVGRRGLVAIIPERKGLARQEIVVKLGGVGLGNNSGGARISTGTAKLSLKPPSTSVDSGVLSDVSNTPPKSHKRGAGGSGGRTGLGRPKHDATEEEEDPNAPAKTSAMEVDVEDGAISYEAEDARNKVSVLFALIGGRNRCVYMYMCIYIYIYTCVMYVCVVLQPNCIFSHCYCILRIQHFPSLPPDDVKICCYCGADAVASLGDALCVCSTCRDEGRVAEDFDAADTDEEYTSVCKCGRSHTEDEAGSFWVQCDTTECNAWTLVTSRTECAGFSEENAEGRSFECVVCAEFCSDDDELPADDGDGDDLASAYPPRPPGLGSDDAAIVPDGAIPDAAAASVEVRNNDCIVAFWFCWTVFHVQLFSPIATLCLYMHQPAKVSYSPSKHDYKTRRRTTDRRSKRARKQIVYTEAADNSEHSPKPRAKKGQVSRPSSVESDDDDDDEYEIDPNLCPFCGETHSPSDPTAIAVKCERCPSTTWMLRRERPRQPF